jgi:hypothetical protein
LAETFFGQTFILVQCKWCNPKNRFFNLIHSNGDNSWNNGVKKQKKKSYMN